MAGLMVTTVSCMFMAKDNFYIMIGDFYQMSLFCSVS